MAGHGTDPFASNEAERLDRLVRELRCDASVVGTSRPDLDAGLRLAESRADLPSQAMLHAALAAYWLETADDARARAAHASAQEIADAVPGPARTAAYLRVASDLLACGRVRDGLDAFERLLGDVPDEPAELGIADVSYGEPHPGLLPLLLVRGYASLGQDGRALDLLHRYRAQAERSDQPGQEATARVFLAWFLAYRGNRAALWHADLAWDYFAGNLHDARKVALAAVVKTWAAAANGQTAEQSGVLGVGMEAIGAVGVSPFCAALLFDLDRYLDVAWLRAEHGLDLLEEARRACGSSDLLTAASAHLFLARRAAAEAQGMAAVADQVSAAVGCLRKAGTEPFAQHALADWAPSMARAKDNPRADPGRPDGGIDLMPARIRGQRLVEAVAGLARLPSMMSQAEGCWGLLAARLSDIFAMERVALIGAGRAPALLGVRGGDQGWRRAILREASTGPSRAPRVVAVDDNRQRIVVSFPATGSVDGVAVMENCFASPRVGPGDDLVLAALGEQLSMVFETFAAARRLMSQPHHRPTDPSSASQFGAASPPEPVDISATVRSLADRCLGEASSPAIVMLRGESVAGKEALARAIHVRSARARGPFVSVRSTGRTAVEVARALFGFERGAFVGAGSGTAGAIEQAHGGTVYLDNVAALAPPDQARVARLLRHGTFERCAGTRVRYGDVQVVLAAPRDLDAQVHSGHLREEVLSVPRMVTAVVPDMEHPAPVPMSLDEVERQHIAEVLRHTRGKITGRDGAAAILKLHPSTLNWRIDKLGLREVRAQARAGRPRPRAGKGRGSG